MAKKKKAKRKKLTPYPRLRKNTRALFRQYVRVARQDERGYLQCVTCSLKDRADSNRFDAGHYIHNRENTYYDLRNCHPQCKQCNGYKDGAPRAYAIYLVESYKPSVLAELEELSKIPRYRKRQELEQMCYEFRENIRAHGVKPCC